MIRTKFAWLTLCLWLVGCQSSGLEDLGSDSDTKGGPDFETVGKLALRAPGESLSVRFRWQQAGERYDLELWGPFGQGRTRLVGDAQQMSVLDGQGQVLSQGPPELVVRRQIGWELPLLALVDWAQGKPMAGAPVEDVSRDAEGRFQGFVQENWRIEYLAYYDSDLAGGSPPEVSKAPVQTTTQTTIGAQSKALGIIRPKRMALTTGDYRLKVAFNRWHR